MAAHTAIIILDNQSPSRITRYLINFVISFIWLTRTLTLEPHAEYELIFFV